MKRTSRNCKEKKPLIAFGQFILPLTVIMALALLFFSVKLFFLNPNEANLSPEEKANMMAKLPDEGEDFGLSADALAPLRSDAKKSSADAVQPAAPKKKKKKNSQAGAASKDRADSADLRQIVVKPAKTVEPSKSAEPSKTVEQTRAAGPAKPSEPAANKPASSVRKEPAAQPQAGSKAAKEKPAQAQSAAAGQAKKTEPGNTPSEDVKRSSTHRWDVQIGGFSAADGARQTLEKAQSQGYDAYIVDSQRDGAPFYKIRVRGSDSTEEAKKLADKLAAAGYPVYVLPVRK